MKIIISVQLSSPKRRARPRSLSPSPDVTVPVIGAVIIRSQLWPSVRLVANIAVSAAAQSGAACAQSDQSRRGVPAARYGATSQRAVLLQGKVNCQKLLRPHCDCGCDGGGSTCPIRLSEAGSNGNTQSIAVPLQMVLVIEGVEYRQTLPSCRACRAADIEGHSEAAKLG
jgi:hypothetical protein